MGNGMNKVLPGLYVGNYRDSKDPTQLDRHKITHIVAIHDGARRLHPDKHYLCVMASDSPDQNLTQYFSLCNDFIHAARLRDGNVLIHCLAGMSRSVTVAVAYIMSVTNLSWKEALKVVRAGRAVANPNTGFQRQLQEFETYKLIEERRRLKERYPSLALEAADRLNCTAMLDSYQSLLTARHICEGTCAMGVQCPTGMCRNDSSKRVFSRKISSPRMTPPSAHRLLPTTPSPSAPPSPHRAPGGTNGLHRSASTVSGYRPTSSPAGLYSYTGSAPPSRSGSRLDISGSRLDISTSGMVQGGSGSAIVVGGSQWARHRAGSAPSTPQPSPPCSPRQFTRRNTTLSKRRAI